MEVLQEHKDAVLDMLTRTDISNRPKRVFLRWIVELEVSDVWFNNEKGKDVLRQLAASNDDELESIIDKLQFNGNDAR